VGSIVHGGDISAQRLLVHRGGISRYIWVVYLLGMIALRLIGLHKLLGEDRSARLD